MSKIRVCHFTTVHNALDTRIYWKECLSLYKAGFDVCLIAQLKEQGACHSIHHIPLESFKPRLVRVILAPFIAIYLAFKCKASIYHFHDPELIPFALLLRLLTLKPVIFDVHEDNITVIKQRTYIPLYLKPLLVYFYLLIESVAKRVFHIVIAEKYYQDRLPNSVSVLNYPIVEESYGIGCASSSKPVCISENAPYWLIYTGSVREDRGAFVHSRLVALHQKVGVYSAGNTEVATARKMQETASQSPRLIIEGSGVGKVPRKRLDELTSSYRWLAGLALFPKSDHFDKKELTKFFEYMKDGIPILCTDMLPWKQFVESNGVGLSVNIDDDQALIRAIDYLIDNPSEVIQMGIRGQQLIRDRFRWDNEARKLVDLYCRLSPSAQ